MKTRGVVNFVVIGVLLLIACCGCSTLFKHRAPTATVFPTGKIEAGGDAAAPAHVNETVTHAAMPVPAASTVTTSPADGTVKVQVSQPTQLTVDTKNTKVDGPVAFTPPAPPTPAQEAQGFGVKIFWVASLLCVGATIICLYGQHWLAAGCCGAAAVALPVLASFFSSQAAVIVGSILVTAGIVFVIAWYLIEHQKKSAATIVVVPTAPPAPKP